MQRVYHVIAEGYAVPNNGSGFSKSLYANYPYFFYIDLWPWPDTSTLHLHLEVYYITRFINKAVQE